MSAALTALPNPYGMPVTGVRLVRVGSGLAVHIWDPDLPVILDGRVVGTGSHLCKSGKNAGRGGPSGALPQAKYTDAQFVTCTRCMKLARANFTRYGTYLRRRT